MVFDLLIGREAALAASLFSNHKTGRLTSLQILSDPFPFPTTMKRNPSLPSSRIHKSNTRLHRSFGVLIGLIITSPLVTRGQSNVYGYPVVDGNFVHIEESVGWLMISYAPWAYCYKLDQWIYIATSYDLGQSAGFWSYLPGRAKDPEEKKMASNVGQGPITWTFDKEYEVGQFANGDWWVVGPVVIKHISPEWDGTRNGAMVNPVTTSDKQQALDTRVNNVLYVDALNLAAHLPATVSSGSSIVSVTGLDQQNSNNLYIDDVAVLTVLDSPPPEGTFRPAWAGTDKTLYGTTASLNYDFLRKLSPVANTPSKTEVEGDGLDHVLIDLIRKPAANTDLKAAASGNRQHYGREIAYKSAKVALWLNLDYPDEEKESVLIKAVQRGIDIYGLVKFAEMEWPPNGGHSIGRKLYLVLAALALNNREMLEWCDGQRHPVFAEDTQHFIISQEDVNTPRSDVDDEPFTIDMIGLPEWASNPLTERNQTGSQWDISYRVVAGAPNTGTALAATLMGVRTKWNWDPFFDYIATRYWPTEESRRANAANRIYLFVANLWDAYYADGAAPDTIAPDAPTGLTIESTTAYSIDLSWEEPFDNTIVTGYHIRIDEQTTVTVTENRATLTNLSPDTTYSFAVSAFDAAGNESPLGGSVSGMTQVNHNLSIASITANVHPDMAHRTADGNPGTHWTASAIGDWIEFTLDEPHTFDAIGIAFADGDLRSTTFEIQASNDQVTWITIHPLDTSSGVTTELETFSTLPLTGCFLRIVARSETTSIAEVQLTLLPATEDTTAPSAPGAPIISNIRSTSLQLDWVAATDPGPEASGIIAYLVYRDNLPPVTTTEPHLELAELSPNQSYTFTIISVDAAGNLSPASEPTSATTSAGILSTYTVTGHPDDRGVRDDGSLDSKGASSVRVGGASNTQDSALILVFEIPSIPSNETIINAVLTFDGDPGGRQQTGNMDLYGLPSQSNTTITGTQYYDGNYGGDPAAQALQDDIMTPASPLGLVQTDETGSLNLAAYLRAQLATGAQPGDYILLRLNSDVTNESNYKYYEVTTANGTHKPSLLLTAER